MLEGDARPRVLHLVSRFLPITENWIYPLVTMVPGVDYAVLCRYRCNEIDFPLDGSPTFLQNLGTSDSPSGAARLFNRVLMRLGWPAEGIAGIRADIWRPSILHAHFGTHGWEALPLKKRYGIPLITSFYGFDAWMLPTEQPGWRQRYAELFSEGDLFLAEGPAMRQRLLDLGCPTDKIRIHRIGVRPAILMREQKSFSEGLRIAMVGRFVEKKGFVDGLRACERARGSGAALSVTIIGDAVTEDAVGQSIKQELLAIAHSETMSGHVRFTGFLPQMETRATLATHNVLLCPSKHTSNGDAEGGSPVVLTESMAMGLLCVGTRHCDIPEVILDQRTGYLFEEGNVEELGNILSGLLVNPGKLLDLTRAGREHIEHNFNLSGQLEALGQLYRASLPREVTIMGQPRS